MSATKYIIHFDSRRSQHPVGYARAGGEHGHNGYVQGDTVEAAVADQRRVMDAYGWTGTIRVVDARTKKILTTGVVVERKSADTKR
jgi:hypothetical protein